MNAAMSVLEPEDLKQSPLADLHALATELGIEDYRRLRREQLVEAILASQGEAEATGARPDAPPAGEVEAPAVEPAEPSAAAEEPPAGVEEREEEPPPSEEEEIRSGTLDVLPNGSGFVRADAFRHSSDDVYVSPAQIRRCELRTGDEVGGPVRPPRRSERYPSLVRVETVNGGPAEPPAERPLFAELTPAFARERLEAPDELAAAPFGKGSRVVVMGPPGAGATTSLRRIAATLAERHPDVALTVVLAGARPEEIGEWRSAVGAPVVGGSFDESPDRQGEDASIAIERAKRAAERGDDAAVVIDSLDHLPPNPARRVFGAARNTEEAGSVTVIAAAGLGPGPARHATTRIVLEPGAELALDSAASGTLRADLLS
jgi:transcription termination factor Rho